MRGSGECPFKKKKKNSTPTLQPSTKLTKQASSFQFQITLTFISSQTKNNKLWRREKRRTKDKMFKKESVRNKERPFPPQSASTSASLGRSIESNQTDKNALLHNYKNPTNRKIKSQIISSKILTSKIHRNLSRIRALYR